MVSIFTDQEPDLTDASDGGNYSLGTKWFSGVIGHVTHGRWWFPDNAPTGSVDWVLYDEVTEVELARATFADTTPGWQTVALGSPVAYSTPNTAMVAVVEAPNRYVATSGFFEVAVVNAPLTAPADGENGRVGVGAVYPAGTFSNTCYFVDLIFAPSAGSITPDSLSIPIGLGEPTLEEVVLGDVVPDGVAVPVTLGEPTLAWSGAVFPTSVAVPVAVGSPSSGQSLAVTPDGVAVPVALGAPTVGEDSAPVAGPAYIRDTTDI